MLKFSLVVMMAGGIGLANPVMANDVDDDDGDYAAAPLASASQVSKQPVVAKSKPRKSRDVRQYYSDLTVMDDGKYEDCPEA